MPKGKPPLAAAEIELIRRWIAQGAVDDTPGQRRASGTTRTTRRSTPARR